MLRRHLLLAESREKIVMAGSPRSSDLVFVMLMLMRMRAALFARGMSI